MRRYSFSVDERTTILRNLILWNGFSFLPRYHFLSRCHWINKGVIFFLSNLSLTHPPRSRQMADAGTAWYAFPGEKVGHWVSFIDSAPCLSTFDPRVSATDWEIGTKQEAISMARFPLYFLSPSIFAIKFFQHLVFSSSFYMENRMLRINFIYPGNTRKYDPIEYVFFFFFSFLLN